MLKIVFKHLEKDRNFIINHVNNNLKTKKLCVNVLRSLF